MKFWLLFFTVQLLSFLPLYLVNIKQQANPFAFLSEQRFWNANKLKLLYSKEGFSDPFHFHWEFVLLLGVSLMMGWVGTVAVFVMSLFLTLVQVEITYTAVMTYLFSRPPVFRGDGPLIRSGWVLWKENRLWIVLALLVVIVSLFSLNLWMSQSLLDAAPNNPWPVVLLGVLLSVPACYNWRYYDYSAFHHRTVYSGILHCWRNILFGQKFNILFQQQADFFEQKNQFKHLELAQTPDVVHLCIESYGAIALKDPTIRAKLSELFHHYQLQLQQQGYFIASNYSTSPIFTGGSWLSYTSMMYGVRIDNLQLYDGLFQYSDNFERYESIFHILNRNGYYNVLAAPLGGVDNRDVSWDSISRCFQPHKILDWQAYAYQGPRLKFFNQARTYCMPDQYALHHAYQQACEQAGEKAVSLFYCTMNSHVPYDSPVVVEKNWQQINSGDYQLKLSDSSKSVSEKYLQAITYQLELALNFARENNQRELVMTLFGDHQPPFVATESMGRDTPVHVICKSETLYRSLLQRDFQDGLLLGENVQPMRHEAWQSVFMHAMNKAYGKQPSLELPYLPEGVNLFPEEGLNES